LVTVLSVVFTAKTPIDALILPSFEYFFAPGPVDAQKLNVEQTKPLKRFQLREKVVLGNKNPNILRKDFAHQGVGVLHEKTSESM
jgi:hypothetical protein